MFAVVPLWLLLGADLAARAVNAGGARAVLGAMGLCATAAVSVAGVLDALPGQARLYHAWSSETGVVSFLRDRDPVFAVYRYLAQAPGVHGVLHPPRPYHALPGYYYLYRAVPFYDGMTMSVLQGADIPLHQAVSHIVTSRPDMALPGYVQDRSFGSMRNLRRERTGTSGRTWEEYAPVVIDDFTVGIMRRLDPNAADPPARRNIRFSR